MKAGERELIEEAIVRLRARIFALSFGMLAGTGILVATVLLLIRGGENVGQHLRLLSNYCPGYDVTWAGALLGFLYGLLYGAIAGYALAWIYNRVALRRMRPGRTS